MDTETPIRFIKNLMASDVQPGDAKYVTNSEDKICRLHYICPGCKEIIGITLKPVDEHGWDFNGDLEKPTCRPSIRCGCKWHGYLTDGILLGGVES